jgi:pyruvate/2-oxoglutarate dehydrogenase complex dihydrolipoamide dehydrogenase (E3) component
VRAAGDTCQIVRFPYSHNERAVTDAEPIGLMKFLIDGKRRLIGAHIAGTASAASGSAALESWCFLVPDVCGEPCCGPERAGG